MPDFDDIIAIDWSGARNLRNPALAVAAVRPGNDAPVLIPAPDHRHWSRTAIAAWIMARAHGTQRTLIGIDSNFGYAAAIMHQHRPGINHAAQLWALIDNTCAGTPDYFAQPFWQHPAFAPSFWISGKQPAGFNPARRITESACHTQGTGWPETPFKLIGAKQVGKGGLATMRMLHHLRTAMAGRIAVWPFDGPDACAAAVIVITEIYPRLFIRDAGLGNAKIRAVTTLDAALAACGTRPYRGAAFSDHQSDALIAAAGMRHVLHNDPGIMTLSFLSPAIQNDTRLEGWIFGVKPRLPG